MASKTLSQIFLGTAGFGNQKMMLQVVLFTFLCSALVSGKIHHLQLRNDERSHIILSSFGYQMQGTMDVKIDNFSILSTGPTAQGAGGEGDNIYKDPRTRIGFTLSQGDEVPEFLRTHGDCFLDEMLRKDNPTAGTGIRNTVFFILDFNKNELQIRRRGTLARLEICEAFAPDSQGGGCLSLAGGKKRTKRAAQEEGKVTNSGGGKKQKSENRAKPRVSEAGKNEVDSIFEDKAKTRKVNSATAPPTTAETDALLTSIPLHVGEDVSTKFSVKFWYAEEEGQYYFTYHNCRNYNPNTRIPVEFSIDIIEKNVDSYLPAGEIPKPSLYFGLAVLFFATGIVWVHIVKRNKDGEIYKVHYLMTGLVFLKSFSLLFLGINFHFISLYGRQQEVWAIVFYIMHLLKGALLFGTIILIGTGYTFFKNFLTERDRKLFLVVIPLQVLDNVAMIIIDETEEGQRNYKFWLLLYILIDLLCCAAIILPVIWSIRHLQEASQEKLRIFRHFYILIICYIFLTRIIRYLVSFTVPFAYIWLVVVVEEVGTWFFFVVTGYKFKPAPNNPYLKLNQFKPAFVDITSS